MIVAHIEITSGGFTRNQVVNTVRFDKAEQASSEYERVAALLKRREERANDIPKTIEIVGTGNRISVPLDTITAIALCDYAHANDAAIGMRDAFPLLFAQA